MNLIRTHKDRFILISNLYTSKAPNVYVYSKTGDVISSFYAGNGIMDCKVTALGETWICYDDEEIFEEGSMGKNGIVCYSQEGEIIFDNFNTYVEAGLVPPIDHCYAVALTNDDIWIAYYSTDLIIVKLCANKDVSKAITLELSPINAIGIGVENGLIVGNQELIRFNLFSKKQQKIKPYHVNEGYLDLERIFIHNNMIFGVKKHHLYCAEID